MTGQYHSFLFLVQFYNRNVDESEEKLFSCVIDLSIRMYVDAALTVMILFFK